MTFAKRSSSKTIPTLLGIFMLLDSGGGGAVSGIFVN